MPDYQKIYATLFRSVTKAIELLQQAQIETEDIYIASDEDILTFIPEHQTENDTCYYEASSSGSFLFGSNTIYMYSFLIH